MEEDFWWSKGRNEVIESVLNRFFHNKVSNWLDVGGGTGTLFPVIKRFSNCLDVLDPNVLSVNGNYVEKDCVNIITSTFEDYTFVKKYKVVSMFDVLSYMKNDDLVFEKVRKIILSSGYFIITVPSYNFLYSKFDMKVGNLRRYSKKRIFELSKKHGFSVLFFSYFMSFLFPVSLFSRGLIKLGFLEPDFEFNFSKRFGFLFYRIFSMEKFFLSKGIKFPFGLSMFFILVPN